MKGDGARGRGKPLPPRPRSDKTVREKKSPLSSPRPYHHPERTRAHSPPLHPQPYREPDRHAGRALDGTPSAPTAAPWRWMRPHRALRKLRASARPHRAIRPGTVSGGSFRIGITAEGVPSAILTAQACFGGSRHARRLSAIPKKRSGCGQSGLGFFVSEKARPHRSAPRSVERPARPFGDGHRLFAPLKTPVIKAGTVHRRYRRLMPLPVPDAAPLHPVTPTLRLLATGGYALCHARCPLRGCKAGSRSSVPPDRPLP